jgi:mRNA interferase RelE/StbE
VDESRLLIKPSAMEEIETIPTTRDRRRIVRRIAALAKDPRPRGCEILAGATSVYRDRVLYAVEDSARTVDVVKVGHRRDVYERGL